jgi:inhibitor of KinA sporulation pathway (predicted exonuclease)
MKSTEKQTGVSGYLVIDLESTCAEDGSIPETEREIIEIGAVLVEVPGLLSVDEFQAFVRPVRHPLLTPFCSKLTTITQGHVQSAPLFPEVLARLCQQMWVKPGLLFRSWGNYDRRQFEQDCTHHGVAYPFGDQHWNLRAAFSEALGTNQKFEVEEALLRVGLSFEGTSHRAIDDARNIARVLLTLLRPEGGRGRTG